MTAIAVELCLDQNQVIAVFFALMVLSNVHLHSNEILIIVLNKAVQNTASPGIAPPTGAKGMTAKRACCPIPGADYFDLVHKK